MSTPIRKIEHDEFQDLMDQEGDTVPLYLLAALHFMPPKPVPAEQIEKIGAMLSQDESLDEVLLHYGEQTEYAYTPVHLMRVNDACYYEEYDGKRIFILPPIEKIEYDMLSAISFEHGAWAYRIEPRDWAPHDFDEPMDDAWWFFKPNEMGAWNGKEDTNH